MKAWVSHVAGGPETLVLEELPLPRPAKGELRVCVAAVGINFPDSLLIRDLYQVKPPRPLVCVFQRSWTPFHSDRGRCFSVIVDGLGRRASPGLNVAQSSTISLKRPAAAPASWPDLGLE